MAVPLVLEERPAERDGAVEVARAVDGQHEGELLAGERVARPTPVSSTMKNARAAPPRRQAGLGREHRGVLGDQLAVELAVLEQRLLQPRRARPASEMAALAPPAPRSRGVDRVDDHHRVLRRARGRVVEGFGARDLVRGIRQVGALVDDHRHVAGADADRRRAAAIGRAHVVLRAGADDQVDRLHQRLGAFRSTGCGRICTRSSGSPILASAVAHQLDRRARSCASPPATAR